MSTSSTTLANAFATGMSPRHAAITVTTGLLSIMDREELEGVLSHEMSHIKNYDVRLLLIVSTLIGLAGCWPAWCGVQCSSCVAGDARRASSW